MKGSNTVQWCIENSPGILRENRSFVKGGHINVVSKFQPPIDLLKRLKIPYAKLQPGAS